jgi:hypothetical protein
MAETVTLEFLGRQFERVFAELSAIRAEQTSIREDLRVLTAIVMRHDASLSAIIEQLRGMTAQIPAVRCALAAARGQSDTIARS